MICYHVPYLYQQSVQACMAGIVFAKFTKPAHRGKTILFSDQALVTMRNGAFYLVGVDTAAYL